MISRQKRQPYSAHLTVGHACLLSVLLLGCGSSAGANAPREAEARPATVAPTASASPPSSAAPAPSSAPSASASAAASAAPAASAPAAHKPLLVKSGILVMSNSEVPFLTETIYFDDFGARQAKYEKSQMSVAGQVIISEEVTIIADGIVTEFDPETKTGTRRKYAEKLDMIDTAMTEQEIAELTPEVMEAMQYKKLPTKTFDGTQAVGYQLGTMRQWTYHGILLRNEMGTGTPGAGETPMIITAKSARFDLAITQDKFRVPADLVLKDVP